MQNEWLQRKRHLPKVHREWLWKIETQLALANEKEWKAEMAEAKANGCATMTYEEWVAYRQRINQLFEERS